MMAIFLGNAALVLALFAAVAAFLTGIASVRFASEEILQYAKTALGAVFGCTTLAVAVLLDLLITSDFRVQYVADETERALPLGYKIAALWSGQSGSLLLWAWLLAAMSFLAVLLIRRKNKDEKSLVQHGVACAVLSVVIGFFVAVILLASSRTSPSNPFFVPTGKVLEAQGMNPMLQNFGMIVHPPLLFLGYSGFAIPFAFMFGALLARRSDDAWVAEVRRWTLAAWLFLTVGILLGAQWAYVELGWGGYWSWDPVENASLLPWFAATALLHCMVAQDQRGMLRRWTAFLAVITFLMCLLATYLTRSGVMSDFSTHSYAKSNLGIFFLVFMWLVLIASLVLLVMRWSALGSAPRAERWPGCEVVPRQGKVLEYAAPPQRMEHLISREGVFLLANLLLLAMLLLTLVGTIFPLLSHVFNLPLSVGRPYYDQAVLPLALVLAALMPLGPALSHNTPTQILRHLWIPLLAALAAVVIGLIVCPVMRNPWCIAVTAISAAAFTCVIAEFLFALSARMQARQENGLLALLRLLDSNHRRYGAQITHLGLILLIIGVTGSSLFHVEKDLTLSLHQSQHFAGGTLTFDSIRQTQENNYLAVEADVFFRDSHGQSILLQPQRRFYHHAQSSEVAIRSNLARDLYATLDGWKDEGNTIAMHAMINPLVNWIWIGGLVMIAGILVCLIPRLSWASLQPEIRL